MRYNTNIPVMVGLSGSSAIVVSAFRGLLRYFGLTISDLGIIIEGSDCPLENEISLLCFLRFTSNCP